jgi:hypothetical protein
MLFVMLAWIFALLEFHTREYATVRQHYLKGSDDPNQWRDLHMAEADGTLVRHHCARCTEGQGEMQLQRWVVCAACCRRRPMKLWGCLLYDHAVTSRASGVSSTHQQQQGISTVSSTTSSASQHQPGSQQK